MTSAARKILEAALALPEPERLELVSELLASVDGSPEPDWDRAWLEELEKRTHQRTGPSADWSEVRARVIARLKR